MRVLYYDIVTKLPMGNNRAVASLSELLSSSDFVTLHVPATRQTANMFGAVELSQMRPGSYLLNLSRGNVVVIEALAEALEKGHLRGAAVDVFPSEPAANGPGFESALRGQRNVILTPHIGGSTEEAQEAIGVEVASATTRFVNAGTTARAVNFPELDVPVTPHSHRILNVHRNVPGVLGDINRIVSELSANIRGQVLATDPAIGYLVMDLDQDVSHQVMAAIERLGANIRTRILY
jgi:D-3-phosphoglycerate dehydrogenase